MPHTHGFERILDREIRELRTRARFYRHLKTGAELLSLANEDENKVFGITFRTPPADSTGVAHILEHSVLCGSRRYPVKEPFVELLKGSLQTFLNAMTYPDKTCYPVASQNLQDFYNLVDVYLDAVFYPRIDPFVFQQEGWHYEIEGPDAPLTYRGVVFNEMKGAYSSPDTRLAEYSQQSLFPDNPYGLDSGGDPRAIPSLTYERFTAFHHRYYHPSNSRIFFYGDDDPEQRLRLADEYLGAFDRLEIASAVSLQVPFERPRKIRRTFPAGGGGEQETKGMTTLNWLLEETTRTEVNFAFHMLEYILLGMPGSPLRKALMDSGLGEDLAGLGLGSELRQMMFSTGLKGIASKDADDMESLVLDTLKALARDGIDPRTVEAAVNTMEFGLRENNTGPYPRGLALMLRALTTWLYDEDPLAAVAFEAPLEAVKSRIASEGTFFESMIDRWFLENPHRTTVMMEPDPDMARREEEEEMRRLQEARAGMSEKDLQKILQGAAKLKAMQAAPDPPEALALIPCLALSDLGRENRLIPLSFSPQDGIPVLYHDLFTNGIVYLDLGFNLHGLPPEYLPYARLFGRALTEMGTEREDYVSLTRRISQKTGGIHHDIFTCLRKDSETGAAWLFLRAKAVTVRTDELLDILRDVLLTVRLDNRERFRQMVLESKARQEQALVPAGHQMVALRLRAHFSEAEWAAEQMKGISYLLFLRRLAGRVDQDWPSVLQDLEEIRNTLMHSKAMIANVTLEEKEWAGLQDRVQGFLQTLPSRPADTAPWPRASMEPHEALTIPAQVNYVGKGAPLYSLGYRFHGSAHVITRYLRNSWLWDRIRVQGGAYGAFCLFDRLSGILSFVSYRDPNIAGTLKAFDESARFLRETEITSGELTKSIIGTIGDIDQYQLPDAKGYTSMLRHLSGESDADRQRVREEVLETAPEDFKAFARVLEQAAEKSLVKVLGSEKAVKEAFRDRPGWLKVLKVL
ncbi:MAG: insulinase family protein [Deltaproteobacteria bacterium]|nr:insulinase family protein [Deltaproteobacteria bacterium]